MMRMRRWVKIISVLMCAVVMTQSATLTAFAETADADAYLPPQDIPDQDNPWYVEVDLYNQIVTVYAMDEEGQYTCVVKQFPCSGGTAARNTESKTPYLLTELQYAGTHPPGATRTRDWGEWGWTHYVTDIWGIFLFHTVLYADSTFDTYIKHSYTDISFPASHGCVRLRSEDAKWLFDHLAANTLCETTKNDPNPELTQYFQPLPPRDGNRVAPTLSDFTIRTTDAQDIDWERLNEYPEGYKPGNFK